MRKYKRGKEDAIGGCTTNILKRVKKRGTLLSNAIIIEANKFPSNLKQYYADQLWLASLRILNKKS